MCLGRISIWKNAAVRNRQLDGASWWCWWPVRPTIGRLNTDHFARFVPANEIQVHDLATEAQGTMDAAVPSCRCAYLIPCFLLVYVCSVRTRDECTQDIRRCRRNERAGMGQAISALASNVRVTRSTCQHY